MQSFKTLFVLSCFLLCSCASKNKENIQTVNTPANSSINSPINLPKKKVRVALILGAGGTRGLAHVGVLEVLEEHNIPIDLLIGCSSGSIIAALYADNPNSIALRERLIHLKSRDLIDTSWLSALQSPWRPKGPVQGYLLQKFLNNVLRANLFKELKIPLLIAVCDLHSGDLLSINTGSIIPAIIASCSIPPFFAPIDIDGRTLVDGGVSDPVPVVLAKEFEPDLIIAVDIATPLPKSKPSNLLSITNRCAHISYIHLSRLRSEQADVVIKPKLKQIGIFDDTKNWFLYEAGKKAANDKIEEILEKLNRR